MTTKAKWILAGVIVVVLLVGLVAGGIVTRWVWGYGPGYMLSQMWGVPFSPRANVAPGAMMGQGQRWGGPQGNYGPGMMGRGNYGPGMMGRGGFGPGMMGRGGFGSGMMGRGGFGPGMMGGNEDNLFTIAAEKLGLKTDELATQLKDGKTIADLAKEKDVAPNTIVDAVVAAHTDDLAQLVKDGKLTQEQADAMQAMMKANLNARLSQKWSGGGFCSGDTDNDGACEGPGASFGPMGRWQ